MEAYSYGDSVGFSPNFPFNPLHDAQEPVAWQMCRNNTTEAKKSFD